MVAVDRDLLIEQGATWTLGLTYEDGNGDPIDLTGHTARMQIRLTHDAAEIIASLTTENGAITLGGVNGTIDLLQTDEQTAAMAFGRARYDIEIEFPDGSVKRLMQGRVTLSPEVTR